MRSTCQHLKEPESSIKCNWQNTVSTNTWAWQRLVLTWPTFYLEHNLFWNVNMSYAIRHSVLFSWLLCTRYVLVAREKICCLCHPLRYLWDNIQVHMYWTTGIAFCGIRYIKMHNSPQGQHIKVISTDLSFPHGALSFYDACDRNKKTRGGLMQPPP